MTFSDEAFSMPSENYSLRSFKRAIIENRDQLFPTKSTHKWLKVHAVRISKDAWQTSLNSFCKRKLGQIWELSLPAHDGQNEEPTSFYVAEYSPRLLLFFTPSNNRRYEKAILRLIRYNYGFGRMLIAPRTYDNLINHFVDLFKPTIYKFYATRSNLDTNSKFRPAYDRRVTWIAKDSFQTLTELRELYGIRPASVFMEFRNGDFQFTNEGLFVLTRQNREMFDALDKALAFLRKDESHFTNVTQNMKLEFTKMPFAKGKILVPHLRSGSIYLKTASLNRNIVEHFMDSSKNFDFINASAKEGSFSWVATAIDREKRSVFGISSNDKTIKLIPKASSTFETFLEFYNQVLEDVDDRAILEPFDTRHD